MKEENLTPQDISQEELEEQLRAIQYAEMVEENPDLPAEHIALYERQQRMERKKKREDEMPDVSQLRMIRSTCTAVRHNKELRYFDV